MGSVSEHAALLPTSDQSITQSINQQIDLLYNPTSVKSLSNKQSKNQSNKQSNKQSNNQSNNQSIFVRAFHSFKSVFTFTRKPVHQIQPVSQAVTHSELMIRHENPPHQSNHQHHSMASSHHSSHHQSNNQSNNQQHHHLSHQLQVPGRRNSHSRSPRNRSHDRSNNQSNNQSRQHHSRDHHHHSLSHHSNSQSNNQSRRNHKMSTSPMYDNQSNNHHQSNDQSNNQSNDDQSGDSAGLIHVRPGDYLHHGRYRVLGVAGQGTFGTVFDCVDEKNDTRIALKIVRAVDRYTDAAKIEIQILDCIRRADPNNESLCVRLYKDFTLTKDGRSHIAIGTEKLGRSLYEFLKKNNYKGFLFEDVRSFAYQLLKAVAFCHSIKLIHTDLKLENILLCHSEYELLSDDYRRPRSTAIRLIDFGGATFDDDHHSRIIQTRQYRAPEVILGLPWSYPSDLWSVGCILTELYTGELLFATHDDLEHCALMEKILQQPIPLDMANEAIKPYRDEHYANRRTKRSTRDRSPQRERERDRDRNNNRHRSRSPRATRHSLSPSLSISEQRDRSSSHARVNHLLSLRTGRLRWPPAKETDMRSSKTIRQAETLDDLIMRANKKSNNQTNKQELLLFIDLIRKCLQYDPHTRITASDALKHPFLRPEVERLEREARERNRQHRQSPNRSNDQGHHSTPSRHSNNQSNNHQSSSSSSSKHSSRRR